jgi:hypothetical protein
MATVTFLGACGCVTGSSTLQKGYSPLPLTGEQVPW